MVCILLHRQVAATISLCEFFAPVRDKMDFVAANGAQVYADGKVVDREVYSHLAIQLAQAVRTFPNLHLALLTEPSPSCSMTRASSCVRSIRFFNAERIWGCLIQRKYHQGEYLLR